MRGATRLQRVLAVAVLLAPVLCAAEPPATETVEEARARLQALAVEAGRVDRWVEENWEAEFARRNPGLPLGPRRRGENPEAYRAREMRVRMAASELKTALRNERNESLEKQRQALLAQEIAEELPVRLGPYDADRGEYPLLLGFGWPADLSIRFRVPEKESRAFAVAFPRTLPAKFRVNEKGEVLLVALERGRIAAEAAIFVAAPGPRLLWQASHDSWVTAVCFRPDGSRVVSAGGDGAIAAWDAETGTRLLHLPDVEMALSLAVSPDGALMTTGGADGYVRLRAGRDGREIWKSRTSGMVFSVAFSPDGRFIASGDDGGTLRVWSAESGKEILRAELGTPVRAVAFSPRGRMIGAGTEGKIVVLWDMAANREVWRAGFDGPVYAVAMSGRGGFVAAAGATEKIRVLREADGSEVWSRKADGEIRTVQFDRRGRLLAAGGAGYTARVLAADTGEPLWSASVGSPVRSVAFGPDGVKLAVGSADFQVRLFEVDEGDRVIAAYCSFGRIYVERERVRSLLR